MLLNPCVCGRVGRPFVSPAYSASKAGVVGLTMSVARSVAEFGIRVNAIAPGPIRTELQSSFPEEKMNILRQNFPLGWGSAVDVAESVLYLVSDGSKWMTGSCLDLNWSSDGLKLIFFSFWSWKEEKRTKQITLFSTTHITHSLQ